MNYTLEQTQEAIRQNPKAVRDMYLSPREVMAYTLSKEFTSDGVADALCITKHQAAIHLKALERKGYLVKLDINRAVYGRVIYTSKD